MWRHTKSKTKINNKMEMVPALFFLLLLLPFNGNAAGIAVLWGNNRYDGSLNSTCATGNYNYVSIQLGIHCNPRIKYSCKSLGAEIKYCQSQGIKVVLSLQSRYLLMSSSDLNNERDDPIEFSKYLIMNYLGGYRGSTFPVVPPFGDDVVMDGFDFGSPYGFGQYYYLVAQSIKDYGGDKVFLVASPNCGYPDYTLGPAINDGYFDALWVQFHHNPECQYDPYRGGVGNLLKSWDLWTMSNTDKVFIGVLAAPDPGWGGDGYIPPEILSKDIIYNVKNGPKYGGVMIWDRFRDIKSGYSKTINVSLHMPNLPTSIISM